MTRYAHQTNHYVSRRFGWDCHGLPVEYEIDKKLKITGRDMVLEMGIENYNNECRGIVQRYTSEWRTTVTRLGRWIDFDNDYKTMDPSFMESVWWVFKTMFDKGLVYRGWKVMPYSMTCGTPLSNFEAGLNYKTVSDPAATVTFPLEDEPDVSLLAWTTTPWTLPSNLALCVNPDFDYVRIIDKTRGDRVFIILEKRLAQIFPEVGKANCTDETRAKLYEVVSRLKGKDLIGKRYTPLFKYFAHLTSAFRVIGDGYVTEEGGTGIVHQAPAFGEDDHRVCIANGIVGKSDTLPCPVDFNGRFSDEVPDYCGRGVKEADNDICAKLKAEGRLLIKDSYVHSYPFCWRSDTPLIYKAVPSWFVSVEKVKEKLIANNNLTYWVPTAVQEKRFHHWLRDAKDWAISRNRFWGTPIPLWASDDLEEIVAVGSVEELYELSGVKLTDLHKENADKVTIPSKKGKGTLKRIDEVFDCWFESGSMPYAQLHYPFENKERFENGFPADFIAEGLDQTRGWFYTLMVISTCLFDKPAFKNLVVNGLVLAEDGKKMSKSLKNYPDPNIVIDSNCADALRLYLINSPVVRAETLKFSEAGVNETVRGVLLPWFNAFRFFITCAEIWEAKEGKKFVPDVKTAMASDNNVDIWILAAVSDLVGFVHQEMKAYRLYTVVPRLVDFIGQLTNWYVRLNRDRIKGVLGAEGSLYGLNVLYEVLMTMTQVMAPFTPFFSEYLYQTLRKFQPLYGNTDPTVRDDVLGKADSVHFLMLPVPDEARMNKLAVDRFATLQQAVVQARVARERRRIRSNLPLKNIIVVAAHEKDVEALEFLRDYFVSEINVWNVEFSTDFSKNCVLKVVPDFRALGKRLGKDMKKVAAGINALTQEEIATFKESGSITVCGYDFTSQDLVTKIDYTGDTKKYEASVSDDGSIMVAIDTTVDDENTAELRAKQFIAIVQKLRKKGGLQVGDAVEVYYKAASDDAKLIATALNNFSDLIVKKIKFVPLSIENKPANCVVIAQEKVVDGDISKKPFELLLTAPTVAVDKAAITSLFSSITDTAKQAEAVDTTVMYVQTCAMDSVLKSKELGLSVDGLKVTLEQGKHYFSR